MNDQQNANKPNDIQQVLKNADQAQSQSLRPAPYQHRYTQGAKNFLKTIDVAIVEAEMNLSQLVFLREQVLKTDQILKNPTDSVDINEADISAALEREFMNNI